MSEWEKGRWFNVVDSDGNLWCGTSDEEEARNSMRPGDTLYQQWRKTEFEWREVNIQTD